MASLLMKKILATKNELIILKTTKVIQPEDLIHPHWQMSQDLYDDLNNESFGYDPISRALATMLNSAIHQNKVCFAVTRTSLQNLIRSDQNYTFEQGKAFSSNQYKDVIKKATDSGIFEIIFDNDKTSRKPLGLKIALPEILEYMKVDINEQTKQLEQFLNNKNNDNNKFEDTKAKDTAIKANPVKQEVETKTNKISFKEMLNGRFPASESVNFGLLSAIIETAALNCDDFDNDIFTVSTLVTHYFGKKQKTKAQKEYKENIEEKFESLLGEWFAKDLDIQEPEPKDEDDFENEHTDLMRKEMIARYKKRKAKEEAISE